MKSFIKLVPGGSGGRARWSRGSCCEGDARCVAEKDLLTNVLKLFSLSPNKRKNKLEFCPLQAFLA
jgi:hypothetical protein